MPRMCPTCPFRENGKTEFRFPLMVRSLSEASPICHSTGDSPVCPKEKKIHKEDWLCRGARNFALIYLHRTGFLDSPTDEAWEAKRQQLGV